jgi:hypothetical protein
MVGSVFFSIVLAKFVQYLSTPADELEQFAIVYKMFSLSPASSF